MYKASGGLERAKIIWPTIDLENVKLIGWGAGSQFKQFFPTVNLTLAYTICPLPENEGKVIHGVKVRSPKALESEDPEKVLIVIFSSFWAIIFYEIRKIGKFHAVRGFTLEPQSAYVTKINEISRIIQDTSLELKNPVRSNYAIVMQGPTYAFTPSCLAYNRFLHPTATIILSTWKDQDPSLMQESRRWADIVLESDIPNYMGTYNRNAMIRSSLKGIEEAARLGFKYVIKSRSDHLITGETSEAIDYFARYESFQVREGQLAVQLCTSWKCVPFHLSDQLMCGRTEHMLTFWSCEEDSRVLDDRIFLHTGSYKEFPVYSNESYLHMNYAREVGHPSTTLKDYFNFIKKYIYPIDPYVSNFSLKWLSLFDLFTDPSTRVNAVELASIKGSEQRSPNPQAPIYSLSPNWEWWEKIRYNQKFLLSEAERISLLECSSQDFRRGVIG